MLTLKQGRNETLREYVARFNSEALQIEGYTSGTTLVAIVARLRDEKFLWFLGKKVSTTYIELLTRAQVSSFVREVARKRRPPV